MRPSCRVDSDSRARVDSDTRPSLFVAGLLSQTFAAAAGRHGETGAMALAMQWDRSVTVPAMVVLWLTGAAIATEGGWFGSAWLWAKLALVLFLTALHGIQSGRLRRLRRGDTPPARPPVPALAACIALSAIVIAWLVVTKPF